MLGAHLKFCKLYIDILYIGQTMIYIQILERFYSFRLHDHPQQLAMKSFSTLESLKTYRSNDAS